MKYKLIELSPKDEKQCNCGIRYTLVPDMDGYDLIRIKRGYSEDFDELTLQPGEPAFILDTGKLYIGDENGKPICINPDVKSPVAQGLTAVYDGAQTGDTVIIPYSSMKTADGKIPTKADEGKYVTVLVLNSDGVPIGEGYLVNWNATDEGASFKFGSYMPTTSESTGGSNNNVSKIFASSNRRIKKRNK